MDQAVGVERLDLLGAEARHLAETGVGVEKASVRPDLADGVLRVLHERPKACLALAQRLLGSSAPQRAAAELRHQAQQDDFLLRPVALAAPTLEAENRVQPVVDQDRNRQQGTQAVGRQTLAEGFGFRRQRTDTRNPEHVSAGELLVGPGVALAVPLAQWKHASRYSLRLPLEELLAFYTVGRQRDQEATIGVGNLGRRLETLLDGVADLVRVGTQRQKAPRENGNARLDLRLGSQGGLYLDPGIHVAPDQHPADVTVCGAEAPPHDFHPSPAPVDMTESAQQLEGSLVAHGLILQRLHPAYIVGVNQLECGSPDELVFRIAEQVGEARAHVKESRVGLDLGDHIARLLREGPKASLALSQRRHRPLPLGDGQPDGYGSDPRSGGVLDGPEARIELDASVARDSQEPLSRERALPVPHCRRIALEERE